MMLIWDEKYLLLIPVPFYASVFLPGTWFWIRIRTVPGTYGTQSLHVAAMARSQLPSPTIDSPRSLLFAPRYPLRPCILCENSG